MMASLHRQGAAPFPDPTPPASEAGDGGERDDCVGCKMIREREAWKYEQRSGAGELRSPVSSVLTWGSERATSVDCYIVVLQKGLFVAGGLRNGMSPAGPNL